MNYIVDSIDSALTLLSYVAEHPGLGVTELSTKLGINKSRTYRMLCTLELHRFVSQDERLSTYALGPQAFVLGVAAAQQNTLVRSAQKHMLALNQAINETVVLRVREGLETVCVARCETSHQVRAVGSIGNRRPINSGASGKILLAFAPEAVRSTFLSRLKKTSDAPDLKKTLEELESVSHSAHAITTGELTTGAVAIAVPLRDLTGNTVAALSISGPESRMKGAEMSDYLERLQACSLLISAELGYVPSRTSQATA